VTPSLCCVCVWGGGGCTGREGEEHAEEEGEGMRVGGRGGRDRKRGAVREEERVRGGRWRAKIAYETGMKPWL
jgi:hypothetical protein